MAKTEAEIIRRFENYIEEKSGDYLSWYVGISEDPRQRLFEDHSVIEGSD